jgi:hypothetical protein
MLLVATFSAPGAESLVLAEVDAALAALATRPGWVGARLGRALDDPDRWVLSCEWVDVGSGRRGLTSGLVREAIMPLMNRLPDVECTYEIVRSVSGAS